MDPIRCSPLGSTHGATPGTYNPGQLNSAVAAAVRQVRGECNLNDGEISGVFSVNITITSSGRPSVTVDTNRASGDQARIDELAERLDAVISGYRFNVAPGQRFSAPPIAVQAASLLAR